MDEIFSARKRRKYNKLELFEHTLWLISMFKSLVYYSVLMFENLSEKPFVNQKTAFDV